jgi:hypothetical protein
MVWFDGLASNLQLPPASVASKRNDWRCAFDRAGGLKEGNKPEVRGGPLKLKKTAFLVLGEKW